MLEFQLVAVDLVVPQDVEAEAASQQDQQYLRDAETFDVHDPLVVFDPVADAEHHAADDPADDVADPESLAVDECKPQSHPFGIDEPDPDTVGVDQLITESESVADDHVSAEFLADTEAQPEQDHAPPVPDAVADDPLPQSVSDPVEDDQAPQDV